MCINYLKNLFKKKGLAKISGIDCPVSVDKAIPFTIIYKVKNISDKDLIFGHLLIGPNELEGSFWSQNIKKNEVVTKTYTHPGITQNTSIMLEVGHF